LGVGGREKALGGGNKTLGLLNGIPEG